MSLSHVKVVRENKTIFIQCNDDDLVEMVKKKLQKFFPVEFTDMRLYKGSLVNKSFEKFQNKTNSYWTTEQTCMYKISKTAVCFVFA